MQSSHVIMFRFYVPCQDLFSVIIIDIVADQKVAGCKSDMLRPRLVTTLQKKS